jgi:type I protein arginine methyltransferase
VTSNASSTSRSRLSPLWLTRLVRAAVRAARWLKHAVRSMPAIRDISDEVFFSEFDPAEQLGHEMMLADTVRMDAYRKGIARHVKAGDVVVDLGTGTGILAMLAAQQQAKVVHAIDSSNIVSLAEHIARSNNFTNIRFSNVTSRRLVLDEPVDVVVHEQIGQALVDEGMIEKTLDLKKRLMPKSGRIVPGRFELFLEPASLKPEHRVPFLWKAGFPGIDYSTVREWQRPPHIQFTNQDWHVASRAAIDSFLCDPTPILSFDLNLISDPAEVPNRVVAAKPVRRAGTLDAFCLYFRVIFDPEVGFDTSPFSPRTVWDSIHVRVESRDYGVGETVSYALNMRDRFDFETWTVDLTE